MEDQGDFQEQGGIPDVLRDPVGIVRRRWRWMLVAWLAAVAATSAAVMAMKPRYEATARLMVTTQQIREDLVRTTLQDDILQRIDAMLGEVLSRDRLAQLIDKHDPYPELRDTLTMGEVAQRVREDIRFEPESGLQQRGKETAALFAIHFEARTPEIAAGFVNDLASGMVDESVESRTRQAKLAVSFLRRELERAEEGLREQSRAIREFKELHRGELPAELPANLAKLERLQQQRQSLALQIAEANTRMAMLTTPPSGPEQELSASPEARLEQLRAELRERLGSLTEKHPEIQGLRRQIAQLEEELGVAGATGAGAVPTRPSLIAAERETLGVLRHQLAQTETELTELDRRVGQTPARQEELDGMLEREGVLRENYVGFLKKVQEAELAESLESAQHGERFSVIEQAEPPSEPARSRGKYFAAGLLASLGFACIVGIALELIDPVLVTSEQLGRESGLPVLGSAPRIA